MSIKLILAPLDGSERSIHALCTAQVVANRFGAHIKAVHVRERAAEPYLFNSLPASLKTEYEKVARSASDELVAKVEKQFADFLAQYGIERCDGVVKSDNATASLHVIDGDPGDELIHLGRLVDVITISRPESHRIGGPAVGERLESLLMNTGRPVLVVPPEWTCHKVNHAAVGWNDSPEASRALFMTMPWLSQMEKVSIITSTKREESAGRVVEYLSLHGCKVDVQYLDGRHGGVGKSMLDICNEIGAEFLVVGGFSHTRARQRLFGGVTSYLLKNTNIVTTMVH